MLSPITDDQRIVQELRKFDLTSMEAERFLKNATYHLSVDPAAKGDGSGDKAGVIVAALGDLLRVEIVNGNEIVHEETVAIVVYEDEFYATQTELTEHMVAMTARFPIDTAHIEQVTGLGSAMAESLETHYGISRVVLHGVANKGKAARLRAVAPILENSDPLLPAKVLFPGKYPVDDDGERIPNQPMDVVSDMKHLSNYIINFAVESGYHSLDALTQLCRHLVQSGDLSVHEGEFSRQANAGRFIQQRAMKLRRMEEAVQSYAVEQNDEYSYFGDSNTFV
jgi:hypothetical protein